MSDLVSIVIGHNPSHPEGPESHAPIVVSLAQAFFSFPRGDYCVMHVAHDGGFEAIDPEDIDKLRSGTKSLSPNFNSVALDFHLVKEAVSGVRATINAVRNMPEGALVTYSVSPYLNLSSRDLRVHFENMVNAAKNSVVSVRFSPGISFEGFVQAAQDIAKTVGLKSVELNFYSRLKIVIDQTTPKGSVLKVLVQEFNAKPFPNASSGHLFTPTGIDVFDTALGIGRIFREIFKDDIYFLWRSSEIKVAGNPEGLPKDWQSLDEGTIDRMVLT